VARIMRESRRILRRGGFALHSINCGDHYAYFDRNISGVNYLTYTERKWRRWNNKLLFQNRLRPVDFQRLAEDGGLHVVSLISNPRSELLRILDSLRIAPEFRNYTREQLATTSVDLIATQTVD